MSGTPGAVAFTPGAVAYTPGVPFASPIAPTPTSTTSTTPTTSPTIVAVAPAAGAGGANAPGANPDTVAKIPNYNQITGNDQQGFYPGINGYVPKPGDSQSPHPPGRVGP